MICLIHQTNYLLDQQIEELENQFVEGGGYTEQLAAKRLEHRQQKKTATSPDTEPNGDTFPSCPQCNGPMVLRTVRTGAKSGNQFLGCADYPNCKGTRGL